VGKRKVRGGGGEEKAAWERERLGAAGVKRRRRDGEKG
jgi:hypothetical protein